MRKRLARLCGGRHTFRAYFVRYGKVQRAGGLLRYMLLDSVRNTREQFITTHVWVPLQPTDYIWTPLQAGDRIEFTAEVAQYTKGSHRRRWLDYGFVRPQEVRVIEREQMV